MNRAIAIRHLAFEDLGVFERELESRGYDPSYLDAGIDDLTAVTLTPSDILIILGGPIGADEEDLYPFLREEMRLLEAALTDNVPILGICLGAQLIARALGARIAPSSQKEIGFGAIQLTMAGRTSCLGALESADSQVLHWHGDTFELPIGAALLASSSITTNQAFSVGPTVLALQFHLEVDPTRLEQWLIGHTCELHHESIGIRQLRADAVHLGPRIASAGRIVLNDWLGRLANNPLERRHA